MNMVKMTMNELSQELTAEELRELETAEKKEPVFDDDSPMLMREQLMQFKRINHENTNGNRKNKIPVEKNASLARRASKGAHNVLTKSLDSI